MRRLVWLVVLLAAACSSNQRASHAAAPAASTTSTRATQIASDVISRSQAIANVRKLRFEVSAKSVLSAKLVTEQALYDAERATGSVRGLATKLPPNLAPSRAIWAVMASGPYTPEFGNGEVLRWGVFRVDARSGSVLGSFGSASPPPWQGWKLLKDRATSR